MEKHSISIAMANLKKLLRGVTVQMKNAHLVGGATELYVGHENAKRLFTAKRLGKGMRVALSKEEIRHNLEEGGFASIVSKAQRKLHLGKEKEEPCVCVCPHCEGSGQLAGGSTYNQRLARRTKKTFEPAKKFFEKNGAVLATVANKVILPIVVKAVGEKIGIDLTPGLKPGQEMIQGQIKRMDKKKSPAPEAMPVAVAMPESQYYPAPTAVVGRGRGRPSMKLTGGSFTNSGGSFRTSGSGVMHMKVNGQ